jgi:hypothetical protein
VRHQPSRLTCSRRGSGAALLAPILGVETNTMTGRQPSTITLLSANCARITNNSFCPHRSRRGCPAPERLTIMALPFSRGDSRSTNDTSLVRPMSKLLLNHRLSPSVRAAGAVAIATFLAGRGQALADCQPVNPPSGTTVTCTGNQNNTYSASDLGSLTVNALATNFNANPAFNFLRIGNWRSPAPTAICSRFCSRISAASFSRLPAAT